MSWDEAFDIMAEKFKAALKKRGPERRRHVRLRAVDDLGRLCRAQAVQGRLPLQQHRSQCAPLHGLRGRPASCAPSASTSRWAATTTSRPPTPSCCGARTWPRCTRSCGPGSPIAGCRAPHVRVAVLSTFEHRSFDLADIGMVFKPQTDLYILNAIANHIIKTGRVNKDFVDKHTMFKRGQTDIGYGLRPEHPLQKKATGARQGQRRDRHELRGIRQVRLRLHAGESGRDVGRAGEPDRGAGRALCRSEDQGHQLLDHGLQPAHPRRLVQQPRLQHPSADRENLRARQQPVLADRPALGLRHRARSRHLLASPAGRHGGDQQGASRHRRADLEAARGHHSRQARLSRRAAEPDAEGRPAQRLLGAGQQQPAGRPPTSTRKAIPAIAIPDNFIVVSDAYPIGDGARRRPDPADRDVGGKGRRLRQCRAAHPVLAPDGRPRRARRDRTSGS